MKTIMTGTVIFDAIMSKCTTMKWLMQMAAARQGKLRKIAHKWSKQTNAS